MKENILPAVNAFSGEPGGGDDKHRQSPELPFGLEKPDPYPTKPFFRTTDDEIYQFRRPDEAYKTGGPDGQLPDGLESDGKNPIHWGGDAVAKEDNG